MKSLSMSVRDSLEYLKSLAFQNAPSSISQRPHRSREHTFHVNTFKMTVSWLWVLMVLAATILALPTVGY